MIKIPDEVVEAAARALCLHPDLIVDNHTPICPGPAWRLYVDDARAAIAAALAAWPGVFEEYMNNEDGDGASLCVILPQEVSE